MMGIMKIRKSWFSILLIITAMGAFLRLYGLAEQPALSDEIGVAISAVNYMENGQFGPTMWYHPNLRNIVIYLLGKTFGYGPYVLRGMSLLTGILAITMTGLLLYKLTGDRVASLLASFLLALDEVHITFSRQAINETWTIFFIILAVYLSFKYFRSEGIFWLVLSGIVFGLGLSTKHHTIFPWMVCFVYGFLLSVKIRSFSEWVYVFACLIVLPFTVYVLTYLPWFGRGYDMKEWFEMQMVLFEKMATHQGNPMDQKIDVEAWQWFLRPLGYSNFVYSGGRPYVTIAWSNPLVWLLLIPSFIYLLMTKGKTLKKDSAILWVFVLFFVSYIPLALSTRPIWLLSSLAVIPFAFMIIGLAFSDVAERLRSGKKILVFYMVLVFLTSLLIYPMATGRAKEYGYLAPIVERFRPPFEVSP